MEKQGDVRPGLTPEVEPQSDTKQASVRDQIESLDNDLTKRAADRFAEAMSLDHVVPFRVNQATQ